VKKIIVRRRVRQSGPVDNRVIANGRLNQFNPSVLNLGDINVPSREVEAVAAVFDLAGFTRFCNQVDPHLAVPRYLGSFLDWLFGEIRERLTAESDGVHQKLWAELPFLTKFLGDGALFLWNTRGLSEALICKIVTMLYGICYDYRHEFFPRISMAVDKPPSVLRCGIARGRVFSVGDGRDYIGHCINNASRLQKLSLLTFCFPHRGFNIQECMPENYRRLFVQKSVSVRGIGEKELIWVLKNEFDRLPEKTREQFGNPVDFRDMSSAAGLKDRRLAGVV
jgi:class 3 adenylate cyclase